MSELRQSLVFRDARGALYVLPSALLEQYEVAPARQAEVEQCISSLDVVHLGYPTSPDPAPPAGRLTGLRLVGEWLLPEFCRGNTGADAARKVRKEDGDGC